MDRRWTWLKNDIILAIVIVPVDEKPRHALNSKYCPCNPRSTVEGGYTLYKHQAYDHREVDEYLALKH